MAEMALFVRSHGFPGRAIKDLKTDAVILQGFARKHLQALRDIADVTFAELPLLRRKYHKAPAGQTFLDDSGVLPTGRQCDARVSRLAEEGATALQGHWTTPALVCEPPAPRGEWRELTQEQAEAAVLSGEGLLVQGAPGVGKTYFLRALIEKLRQTTKVEVVAKTHVAVQNVGLGATTCDHWVRKCVRAGAVRCNALVCEELSMIDVQLWADLALVRFKGVQFICAGDFAQYQPVCEAWAGCPVAEGSLQSSAMLQEMCGSNRLTLTENRRSDARLFAFYTGLLCGTPCARGLQEALADARAQFPVTERRADYTIVMSHRRRVQLNASEVKRRKPEEAVYIRAPTATVGGNQAQSMWVWPGQQLVGAGAKCAKGLFFEVGAVTEDRVTLSGGEKLTFAEAVQCLRLPYALTFASVQSLTLPGVVRLDCGSSHLTLRHIYVGISRATAADLVEVL